MKNEKADADVEHCGGDAFPSAMQGIERYAPGAVERREPSPRDLMAQAIALGPEGVAVVRELRQMQIEMEDRQAKQSFHEAMSRLQAKLPQIDKDGQAKNSKFAKLESIDIIARPLFAEEGFSVAFDEESHTEKTVTFLMIISRAGHSESKRLTVPVDVASKNREGVSIRPAIQDAGSTVSYARRYLLKMHLNIIEKDEDTDGPPKPRISEQEALDLATLLQDTKSDVPRFLKHFRVERIGDLLKVQLSEALQMLQRKQAPK